MGRMAVQMPIELKEKLEIMREQQNTKTLYEVIERNIEWLERSKRRIAEMEKEREEEKKRQAADYAFLGDKVKKMLNEFENYLGFDSPANAIEFLIEAFECSPQVGKFALTVYAKQKNKGGIKGER